MFDYRARLTRPYDGDSFWVEADQGMGSRQEEELRLLNVSAPEKYQPGGLECRDFVAAWFTQVSQTRKWPLYVVTVPNKTLEPMETRTFVRYLATVSDITDGSRVLNAALALFLAQHPEWGHGI